MRYSEMKLTEVCALDGVKDLKPTACKAYFAKALMAEDRGDHDEAQKQLEAACAAEAA